MREAAHGMQVGRAHAGCHRKLPGFGDDPTSCHQSQHQSLISRAALLLCPGFLHMFRPPQTQYPSTSPSPSPYACPPSVALGRPRQHRQAGTAGSSFCRSVHWGDRTTSIALIQAWILSRCMWPYIPVRNLHHHHAYLHLLSYSLPS
jgi:hypothetical protein